MTKERQEAECQKLLYRKENESLWEIAKTVVSNDCAILDKQTYE